ncbi:flagellar basal-body rod protein FlgF [Acidihalobacter ferrooxydans]|uniref:Flagellar basal-body rod protein FlgF n=1 Tax=Acidihalobacter ferrooxydans TaxID=1765967 RepID=A0A1P8UGL1_9GAMM|nr:flagellar basal-body rod protein FlgF [Acidihalobacter ferrooxydans]APZ42987.1 flagellar basal-body rod protein FlgF [Acidihalobacter ferrooxydans]
MDRMLYIAMSGAKEIMLQQANTANNLANADTTGFKRDYQAFKAVPVTGPGYASRIYPQDAGVGTDFTPGPLIATGNPLDIALKGPGWIAVQGPNGKEQYTRAGDLRIDANGILTTSQGYPVLGSSGPISIPPSSKIAIGSDGTVTVQPDGQGPNALAVIDQIKLVDPPPSELTRSADGLMQTRNGQPAPAANVVVESGMLEGSNVNPVDSMVRMISLARQYELQVKTMQTAQRNAQASAQLINLG